MTEGTLAATIRVAILERTAQLAAGATRVEADANLEKTLRVSWPFRREWKYLCECCSDHGLDMQECPGDATCGRTFPHLPHESGTPCWCAAGARFKRPVPSDDVTQAGRATKRKVTRWGR